MSTPLLGTETERSLVCANNTIEEQIAIRLIGKAEWLRLKQDFVKVVPPHFDTRLCLVCPYNDKIALYVPGPIERLVWLDFNKDKEHQLSLAEAIILISSLSVFDFSKNCVHRI